MSMSTIALCLMASSAPEASPRLETIAFSGVARTEDGAVFYRETHEVQQRNGVPVHAVTTYRSVGGKLLATLRTDFSKDRFAPSYEMYDAAGRLMRGVRNLDNALLVSFGGKTVDLAPTSGNTRRLVTGQGIDQYARYFRSALASGQNLRVRFPIPTRHAAYEFQLRAIDAPPGVVRVKIDLANFLLAILAPSLVADYDVETGRLVRYYGVSNLTDAQGDNPTVEIIYDYDGGTS